MCPLSDFETKVHIRNTIYKWKYICNILFCGCYTVWKYGEGISLSPFDKRRRVSLLTIYRHSMRSISKSNYLKHMLINFLKFSQLCNLIAWSASSRWYKQRKSSKDFNVSALFWGSEWLHCMTSKWSKHTEQWNRFWKVNSIILRATWATWKLT